MAGTAADETLNFAVARYQGASVPPDTTPPDTTIVSGPSGSTNDSTPTFEFSSSESGSTFECRVDSGAFAPCSSPFTVAALSDGSHTFDVRAIDAVGNVDQTPASRAFTVATSTPPPPDGDGDGVPNASDACPSVAGTAADGCPAGGGGNPSGGSGDGGDPGGSGGDPPAGGGGNPSGGSRGDSGDSGGDPRVDPPSVAGPSSGGSATVSKKGLVVVSKQSVDCTGTGPDCTVRAVVTGLVPAGKASASAKRRAVRLGGSSFKVRAGKKGKVTVKLTRRGLKLVKRLKRVKATVRIVVRRGAITMRKTVRVTLRAPRPGGQARSPSHP